MMFQHLKSGVDVVPVQEGGVAGLVAGRLGAQGEAGALRLVGLRVAVEYIEEEAKVEAMQGLPFLL